MKKIWSSFTRLFGPAWKPQPKKEDVNAPFWLVVKVFFWLFIAALILLSITACGFSPQVQKVETFTPEHSYIDPNTNETIYWSMRDVESIPWESDDYYTLKSWYTEEDGYLQLHQGTKKIFYLDYIDNTKEFRLR